MGKDSPSVPPITARIVGPGSLGLSMLENRNPRHDLFAFVLLVVIVFLSASLLTYDAADPVNSSSLLIDRFYQPDVVVWPQNEEPSNACGYWGALTADILYTTLGVGAFFLVMGLGAVAIALIQRQTIQSLWSKTIGWLLALMGLTTLASMLFAEWSLGPVIGPGGYLGALGDGLLEMNFARAGGIIIAASALIIGLFMWTEYVFLRVIAFALGSVFSVVGLLLPVAARDRIKHWIDGLIPATSDARVASQPAGKRRTVTRDDLNRRRVNNDSYDEADWEDEQVDELDEDDADSWADDEDEEQGVDDEWDNEEEIDDEVNDATPPRTIPFVTKTAASTAAVAQPANHHEAAKETELAETDNSDGSANDKDTHGSKSRFNFGFKKRGKQDADSKPVSERDQVISQLNQAARIDDSREYELPAVKLLSKSPSIPQSALRSQTMRQSRRLEQKFLEFGHKVKVVDVETGPVITQYELKLEAGLRLSKITRLSDDIAIGLRVPSVRIVAPIPGKNTVGIEVPNETRHMVRLRDVMQQAPESTRKMKIPLFLGQNVAGETLIVDLSKLPHLLIAGRTGTGKSVCLNAIISSILMTRRPDEVRMLMIDPKMVELSGYGRLPHLMHPVVTDMRKAEAILAWAVDKMEDRYKLLARAGVRHINSYNQLGEEELIDRIQPQNDEERSEIPINLPFIVIVADEMADLMMTSGKEVEQHIIRLAQKSRAVGIHLILATQKPTVDVITGLIKSNLPARISFQVASQNDSRVVLDANGAEKLLGNGDMLFLWPGTSTLIRGQGTFLSDEEIDAVTDAVSTGEQNFVNELVNMKVDEGSDDELAGKLKSRDELYNQAVEVVIRENRGSVSLLQRVLGIGYGRAARLIDFMEEDGIVGPYAGSKSREIIMTMDQWRHLQSGKDRAENSNAEARANDVPPPKRQSPDNDPVLLRASRFPAVPVEEVEPQNALDAEDHVDDAMENEYDEDEETFDGDDELQSLSEGEAFGEESDEEHAHDESDDQDDDYDNELDHDDDEDDSASEYDLDESEWYEAEDEDEIEDEDEYEVEDEDENEDEDDDEQLKKPAAERLDGQTELAEADADEADEEYEYVYVDEDEPVDEDDEWEYEYIDEDDEQ